MNTALKPTQETRSFAGTAAMVGLVVVLAFFLRVLSDVAVNFPEEFYQNAFLLMKAPLNYKFLSGLLIMTLPVAVFARKLAWGKGVEDSSLRLLLGLLAVVLAWQLASLDYNFYYDTWHAVDRALIVAFALGIFIHPASIPLFVFQALLFSRQLDYPLGPFDWTDKQIMIDLMIYAHAAIITRIFFRVPATTVFFILALVFNAQYFFAGVQKLQLSPNGYEWLTENQVGNLIQASYHNGWVIPFSQETLSYGLDLLAHNPILLTLPALMIEVGSLLVFLNASMFKLLMLAHVVLHAVIFVCSGVLFWKWCLVNLIFLALMPRRGTDSRNELFSRKYFYLSLPLFLLSPILFSPVPLGWFDTSYTDVVRIFDVDSDGSEREIEGFFFGPYNILFQQGRFYYLDKDRTLVGTYGGTSDYFLANQLEKELSDAEVRSIRDSNGVRRYDEERRKEFQLFLERFVNSFNSAVTEDRVSAVPSILSAPYHIYSFAKGARFESERSINKIRVRRYTYFKDRLIDDELLLESSFISEEEGSGG